MVTALRNVMIAGTGARAERLAEHYRGAGANVAVVTFADTAPADGGEPLDLLVIADDFDPPAPVERKLGRDGLAAALQRRTYWPFQLAARLKPRLAAARGRIVLLSSSDARMEHTDTTGAYLERPFRAAAHALWRCLSVEWRPDGITAALVGIDPNGDVDFEDLVQTIAGRPDEAFPAELTNPAGTRLGW